MKPYYNNSILFSRFFSTLFVEISRNARTGRSEWYDIKRDTEHEIAGV